MSLLSDSESSGDERKSSAKPAKAVKLDDRLKINEKFADRFERSERVKDLHRAKELLKNADLDDDEESDSESETEDEDAEQLSTGLDLKIIQTINSLRKKDPKIYDSSTVWFEKNEESDSSDDEEENDAHRKTSKKKKFKDILREQLLESGSNGGLGDGDGIETSSRGVRDTASRNTLVYDAEQEKIRQAFIKSAGVLETKKSKSKSAGHDSDSENDDDILQVKSKSAQQLKAEEIELQKALKEMRELSEKNAHMEKTNTKQNKAKTPVLEIDEGDGFLETYLEKQLWKEKSGAPKPRAEQSDDEDLDGDEEELEQMEKFESKYNFRFEELQDQKARFGEEGGPSVEVVGHARDVQGSMRRVDEKRKTQRESRKERKEKERRQQEAELRRLKNLKRQELRERLKQIGKMSGLEDLLDDDDEEDANGDVEPENGDDDGASKKKKKSRRGGKRGKGKVQLNEDFLDEDWDPEKHEALMAAQFGEDYYDQEDEDFNVADMDDPTAYEQYLGDDGLGEIDYDDDGDDDVAYGGNGNSSISGNAAARAELRKTAADMEEELYQLDYEDIVAGLPCRFKYKTVEKEGFGLSAEDILLADDAELNKYVSLKKISAYTHHSGVNETELSKKRKRLRENVKERLAKLAAEAELAGQQVKGTKPKSKSDEVDENGESHVEDIEAGEDGKKRKRKRRKGTSSTDVAPQLITKASTVAAENALASRKQDTLQQEIIEKGKDKKKDKSKEKSKKPKKSAKEESAQEKRMNLYR